MSATRSRALVALLLTPACASGPSSTAPRSGSRGRTRANARSYRLVLHRPDRVGQRFRNVRTGSQLTRFKVDGQPVPALTKELRYACDGVETILAVTRTGLARKVRYQVDHLRVTRAGKTTDLLPRGTVVLAEKLPGDLRYTVDGKPLAAAARQIFISCLEVTELDNLTDDDYLGSTRPRLPGERWPVDRPKFLVSMNHELKGLQLNPRPRDVSGQVTLVGLARIAGVRGLPGLRALRYRVSILTKNFAPYLQPLVARQGSMHIAIDGWVAQDPRNQARGRRLTMSSYFLGTLAQGGQTKTMEYTYVHLRTEKRTPHR